MNVNLLERQATDVKVLTKSHLLYHIVKRCLDFAFSLVALILLLTLFIVIAMAIKIDSKGSIFFVHKRVGLNGNELNMYKFRTMVSDSQRRFQEFTQEQKEEFAVNYKLENDPRITKLGRFLRRTSLDELPQLLNILRGDMSIVGPRPVVSEELKKYGQNKDILLSARPGLTGYWQVNAKQAANYSERVEMELFYVSHASLLLDLKIICGTIPAIIGRRGVK